MTNQELILSIIIGERDRQDKKWGKVESRYREITYDRWMTILTEEVGEVAAEIQDEEVLRLFTELTQVAAVAIVFMEAILLRERDKK